MLPAIYLPHGGGPWPWMDDAIYGGPQAYGALRAWLAALPSTLPTPRALLVVTAHWEETRPTLSSAAAPGMLYDYGGFPPHTYQVRYPAPGDPALAQRARALLEEAGIAAGLDPVRGYDHGTFVPLAVSWPEAPLPVVQLSLVRGLDPKTHLAVGRALRPLRDEGVLILGSGLSYHNLHAFFRGGGEAEARAFDDWLAQSVLLPQAERDAALVGWGRAPGARSAHPREEHLLPLMVVAGAAGADAGRLTFRDRVLGKPVLAAQFG